MDQQNPSAQAEPVQLERKKITGPIDLLKNTLSIFRQGFGKFIGMSLIPVLGAIPLIAVGLIYVSLSGVLKDSAIALSVAGVILGLLGILSVIAIVYLAIAAQAGFIALLNNFSPERKVMDAFKQGRAYAGRYFVVSLVTGIFTLLWSLLLVIPGIIFGLYYSLSKYALMTEDFESTSALKRSKELIKDYWWAVAGRYVVLGLAIWAGSMILNSPTWFLKEGDSLNAVSAISVILSQIFGFLAAQIGIIYSYLIYKDLVKIKGESKLTVKKDSKGKVMGLVLLFIVIIVVIIGGLSTLAIVGLNSARTKSRDTKRVLDMGLTKTALELYYNDNNKFPNSLKELVEGKYLYKEMADPNGQEYKYSVSGDNYQFCFDLEEEATGPYKKGENCVDKYPESFD